MRCVSSTNGKAAVPALVSNTATFLTNLPDHETGCVNATPEPLSRLDLLREQYRQMGFGLFQVNGGSELTVTGPGTCGAALPDTRAAAIYLRELRRGAHG